MQLTQLWSTKYYATNVIICRYIQTKKKLRQLFLSVISNVQVHYKMGKDHNYSYIDCIKNVKYYSFKSILIKSLSYISVASTENSPQTV